MSPSLWFSVNFIYRDVRVLLTSCFGEGVHYDGRFAVFESAEGVLTFEFGSPVEYAVAVAVGVVASIVDNVGEFLFTFFGVGYEDSGFDYYGVGAVFVGHTDDVGCELVECFLR